MRSTLRRQKPTQPELPVDISEVEASGSPVEVSAATVDIPAAELLPEEPVEVAQYVKDTVEADSAAEALKRQIAQLAHAEALQKQHAQQQQTMLAAQRPMSREERLSAWKQQGLSDEEEHFLAQHGELLDYPAITTHAVAAAQQAGLNRGSPEFLEAVKNNFEGIMRQQASSPQVPEFFRAPPPKQRAAPNPSALVSAPVSREIPTATPRPIAPSKVTLTAEQREAAKMPGITELEYAKNLLRLQRELAEGTRQR